jgi:phosphatidylinositol N-acetylglucosaminyltransferase subunit C
VRQHTRRRPAGKQLGGTLARALRQSTLLLVGVHFLSPLYGTLTRALSDDTIAAASAWLLLAHLYLHDYFFVMSVADKLAGSVSLAAAVAASLLLASRLARPDKVVRGPAAI